MPYLTTLKAITTNKKENKECEKDLRDIRKQSMKNKVEFVSNGVTLRGMLESPGQNISSFALFAHCFTCGKDIAAASRIARALTMKGIAV